MGNKRIMQMAQSNFQDQARKTIPIIEQKSGRTVKCKAGCSHCCISQRITASESEVQLIVGFLESNENISKKATVLGKIGTLSPTKDGGGINGSSPCVFLDNNSCSVYDVRPFACRYFYSDDTNLCANFMNYGFDGVKLGTQRWIREPLLDLAKKHLGSALRKKEPSYEINSIISHIYSNMNADQLIKWSNSQRPREFPKLISSRYP